MGFNPKLVLYVAANTTSTETIPSGSTRVVNEAWGAGGNGATPLGAGQRGGGGGGGGYSLSTFACAANYGQTLIVRVTNTAAAEQTSPATLVSSGSFAISTITAGCGTGGTTGPNGGGGGTGGPVTNANAGALNTNGNNGTAGDVGISGAGGAARAGQVTGDGGPYGAGGATAASATLGAVVFYYT